MPNTKINPYYSRTATSKLQLSEAEWKAVLSDELYSVARLKGTERPYIGQYVDTMVEGQYFCAACGQHLFNASAKFLSTCGWPSFSDPVAPEVMQYIEDHSHGMNRIEALCGRCAAHLGHVFDDGPAPKNLRYCMNSISLDFEPNK